MCREHNHHTNCNEMYIDSRVELISANKKYGCDYS